MQQVVVQHDISALCSLFNYKLKVPGLGLSASCAQNAVAFVSRVTFWIDAESSSCNMLPSYVVWSGGRTLPVRLSC